MNTLKKSCKIIYGVLKRIALFIGTIVSFILLTVMYATVVGGTKIVAVILKKKFLPQQPKTCATFWHDRKTEPNLDSARREF